MQILKGIGLPDLVSGGRKPHYEFHLIELGDCISEPVSYTNKLRSAAYAYKMKVPTTGWNYATRVVGDGTVKLWRVA